MGECVARDEPRKRSLAMFCVPRGACVSSSGHIEKYMATLSDIMFGKQHVQKTRVIRNWGFTSNNLATRKLSITMLVRMHRLRSQWDDTAQVERDEARLR